MKTLRLKKGPDAWYVDFAETEQAARIRDLFGTTVIPTPFTASADAARVISAVAKLNPGYAVVLA